MLSSRFVIRNVFSRIIPTHNVKYSSKPKTAIIMLNMGGPKVVEDVQDFLTRLFSDKELINVPFQSFLSKYIAKRRTPKIERQYSEIGGGSPILHWTEKQGKSIIKHLDTISEETAPHKLYVGFRYAHPLLENVINEIELGDVERVVAFSQYPQYSCTTSGSSYNAVARHYQSLSSTHTGVETIDKPPINNGVRGPIWSFIDRWPVAQSLINVFARNILEKLNSIEDSMERNDTVILFSAHSIPLSVVNRGDSYPQEVAATVHTVMQALNFRWPYRLVWQSKVGPASWLGPATQDVLKGLVRLGHHHAILVPIAFTSDHIETLYEMDVEYCTVIAKQVGMARVHRAPAINDDASFSRGLAEIAANHLRSGELCSRQFLLRCPLCTNPSCAETRTFLLSEQSRLDGWTASQFKKSKPVK